MPAQAERLRASQESICSMELAKMSFVEIFLMALLRFS
jgi:hypothetical protein